jgi:valyl-tRNA synthetase
MGIVQEVVGAVRNIRGTMRVPPGRRCELLLRTPSHDTLKILEEARTYICELVRADGYEAGADVTRPPGSASAVASAIEVYVPLKGLIDVEVETRRLTKEIGGLEKALSGLDKKLENEGFLKNAPQEVVDAERQRQKEYRDTLGKLQGNLAALTD